MERKILRFIIVLVVVLVVVAIGPSITDHYSVSLFGGGDSIISVVKSPNHHLVATVFERNMGATTNYATIVTLHARYLPVAEYRDRIVSIDGRTPVTLQWTDAHTLHIECPEAYITRVKRSDAELRNMRTKWYGVRITYSTKDKP